jgi:pantoate--beta-alanine ligase
MRVVSSIAEIKRAIAEIRCTGRTIGLVPTMGALHEGHLQLLRTAAAENAVTVCSIFINPAQFNDPDDYRLYPRLLDQDTDLLGQTGCDLVFAPEASAMYPQSAVVRFDFGRMEEVMEGEHRPGHFNGVATVVSKLFHIVKPHRAYFGQKDLQQFVIIRQLVQDLHFDLELVRHPTVRAEDGLALSSRNLRLSPTERHAAPRLYQALQLAAGKLGEEPVATIKSEVAEYLAAFPAVRLEYFEVADAGTLEPLEAVGPSGQTALCIAAWVGPVRLIDNVVV